MRVPLSVRDCAFVEEIYMREKTQETEKYDLVSEVKDE
jgi:hypothetical protein